MKAIKRTVAGLLATLMFASCFSFNFAFGADNYTDDEAIAVSKVNAANIMTGTDNGFEPSKTLTRAEAAAIVVRMKGVPASQVEGAKGNTLFTDVPASSWAAGYINAASAMGIISGVGNGLFLPEREVSIVEFSAMAIRALGAGKLVDSIGTWPTNYVNFATEEKLFDGVLKAYTAPATRMDVAFMVVNTIEANMWEKSSVTNTSEVTYNKTSQTILENVLEVTVKENQIVNSLDTKDRTVTFTSGIFNGYDVAKNVELATLKAGMEVDVWAKAQDKEIIRIAPAEISKQAQVTFNGIKKIDVNDKKVTLLVDGSEKKYNVDTTKFAVSFNTLEDPVDAMFAVKDSKDTIAKTVATQTLVTPDDTTTPGVDESVYETTYTAGDAILLANDDIFGTVILEGNKITTIYAEAYESKGVVKDVKNDKIYFEGSSKIKETQKVKTLDLDDEDVEYVVTKNGKEFDVTDIEKGDALYFYEDTNTSKERYVIVVNNNKIEGTAKQVSKTNYVNVEGNKYKLSPSVKTSVGTTGVDIAAGDEVRLYLNGRNEVVMYQILDDAVDSTVAMVKSVRIANKTHADQAYDTLEIVLVSLDGKDLDTKVVNVEKSFDKFAAGTKFTATSTGSEVTLAEDKLYEYFSDQDADATTPSDLVGKFVRYTISDSKVVIREFVDAKDKVISSYSDTKIEKFSGKYNAKNNKLDKFRLDENTVIYLAKTPSENENYSVKFEKINFEDLGTMESAVTGYVYGVDESTSIVDAVLFTKDTDVTRSKENNYAIVLAKRPYDGVHEDCEYEADLVLADGSVLENVVLTSSTASIAPLDLIEAFVEGDKLVDVTPVLANNNTTDIKLANIISTEDTLRVLYKDGGLTETVNEDISENCIYVKQNAKGINSKASAAPEVSLVDEINPDTNEATGKYVYDAKKQVSLYIVDNTETKDKEVVAIFYVDAE